MIGNVVISNDLRKVDETDQPMLYYIFSKTDALLSKWELIKTLKSRRAAIQVLKDYKRLVGSQQVIEKEALMVEAESEAEARIKLTDLLDYSAKTS